MISIIKFALLIILFTSCSFNDVGGFWSQEKDLKNEMSDFESLFNVKKLSSKEFNKKFNFLLNKKDLKVNTNSNKDSNDGYVLFEGKLERIQKYNFSKIENFHEIETNLVFNNDNLIFFDNKGSILSFDKNSKLKCKIKNYSKI